MRLIAADELKPADLLALFNAGYSDYVVPLRFSEAVFREHVVSHGIDLSCSRVLILGRPAAFALIARRGADGWVGGMGTVPAERRRGLGERALGAGIEAASAAGCDALWLEVIDSNQPAIGLYTKLGFEIVRDVLVWSLAPTAKPPPPSRPVGVATAHAWIAANRGAREPWQRSDETVAAVEDHVASLSALVVERGADAAAAVIYRENGERVSVLQVAALDRDSAADALLAAARAGRSLRLANTSLDDPASCALHALGAEQVARQHEMLLRL